MRGRETRSELLTESVGAALDSLGFVQLPGALSRGDLALASACVQTVVADPWPGGVFTSTRALRSVYGVHRRCPELLELIRRSPVYAELVRLQGEVLYPFQSQLHLKPLGNDPLWWHQDYEAFRRKDGLPDGRGVAIIILTDEVGPENGPMFVVPGSHRVGLVDSDLTVRSVHSATREQITSPSPQYVADESAADSLALRNGVVTLLGDAGDMVVMDLHLLHASGLAMTSRRRALLHVSLLPDSVRTPTSPRPRWIADCAAPPLDAQS